MSSTLIFLCIAGFFATLVDSIAGGGGLISLPAYMLTGMPTYLALGTNKFSASCGSFTSSLKFAKSKILDFKLLRILVPFTFIGAILGVNTVLIIDTKYLNVIVLILLLSVGIYSLFSKTAGIEDKFQGLTHKSIFWGILLAFSLGFYDGFFGAGVGSFLIFGLVKVFSFNFVRASANSKILNFTSNITSLVMFAIKGQIDYKLGIPVAIFMILGAQVGTRMALDKGVKLIKPLFVTMSLGVALKMLYEIVL